MKRNFKDHFIHRIQVFKLLNKTSLINMAIRLIFIKAKYV